MRAGDAIVTRRAGTPPGMRTSTVVAFLRITVCALAAAGGAIALLRLTSLPTAVVLTLPTAMGVLLVQATGGTPATGPASIDAKRVERAVSRIILAAMLIAVVYFVVA